MRKVPLTWGMGLATGLFLTTVGNTCQMKKLLRLRSDAEVEGRAGG
jgi:hypothetical protein